MRIIDVSDPAGPKEVGSFTGPGNVTSITIAGKRAYLADYSGGLYVVDAARPEEAAELGRYGDFVVGDVAVVGNYALLAAGELDVVDVSKPDRPTKACSFSNRYGHGLVGGGGRRLRVHHQRRRPVRLPPHAAGRVRVDRSTAEGCRGPAHPGRDRGRPAGHRGHLQPVHPGRLVHGGHPADHGRRPRRVVPQVRPGEAADLGRRGGRPGGRRRPTCPRSTAAGRPTTPPPRSACTSPPPTTAGASAGGSSSG